MLATLFALSLAAAEPDIVVSRSAAIPSIERILAADNLDIEALSPREVAAAMAGIKRGAAPAAFWQAYQAHVRAWTSYADAIDAVAARPPGEPAPASAEWAVGTARTAINATFDEVERQARHQGARLPLPRTRL
ncbi:hypothetical protein [Sphingomonas humi]|uniref:Uncharacterized protein n=1 Tax=Sphingomonas humi TaxID=335630 RepID=A0ABP7RTT7_9SPHN